MFSGNTSQVSEDRLYVEDVFSTYLYTGNGASQTITNGIDLAGKGGLVWLKSRSGSGYNHVLTDTVRGVNATLVSNSTAAQFTASTLNWAFLSSGFSFNNSFTDWNASGATYASWTFREAPKFFDVVTYTGNGGNGRAVSHNLGTTPGFIIVKRTNNTGNWYTWHRAYNGGNNRGALNSAGNFDPAAPIWGDGSSYIAPTSTTFTVSDYFEVNGNSDTFVAYLFAHDPTADGIIQCGSYTGNGSINGPEVNLGWEPQWVMVKNASATGGWMMYDNMRGMFVGSAWDNDLKANLSSAEAQDFGAALEPTATGFKVAAWQSEINGSGNNITYIAIRRGPMRTPTLGTSVFAPVATRTATGATVPPLSFTSNFPVDLAILGWRDGGLTSYQQMIDRLRMKYLTTSSTGVEGSTSFKLDDNNGMYVLNIASSSSQCAWMFRRAPGFFDEVCYTGTGSARTINHNLGVAPELMIVKARTATGGGVNPSWAVYAQALGNTKYLLLNSDNTGGTSSNYWNNTTPTSSVFSVFQADATNASATTYVSYLFASCPGVSKVGSYTGTGTTQTIDCGFAAGARFVLIKRTDSTGDWYVWDTARGIVAGNDPHLSLNTTAAEVTTNDTIDTDSSGFVVNQVAATNVNVSSATYIYLAIA